MKNVLILEDDPANLQIFAALLWSKGHKVFEATTAEEALKAGDRDQRLDLFVSDVLLKGSRSGVQVHAEDRGFAGTGRRSHIWGPRRGGDDTARMKAYMRVVPSSPQRAPARWGTDRESAALRGPAHPVEAARILAIDSLQADVIGFLTTSTAPKVFALATA